MAKKVRAKGRARTAEQPERGGVQSVKVAARVLKALAFAGGTAPLKDLASATGLARAKVHRYLTSLRNAELVLQNSDTGQYQIGPAAVAIGLVGLRRISPVAEVCAALPALRDLINQTVTVAVWSEAGPVVVAMQESDDWITMNIRIGSRLPILTTAIGRTFLAHLPDAVVRPLVVSERKEAQARRIAMPSNEELDGLTNEIRLRRLSRAPSALFPGVDAIAAPVFDYRNDLVAVMCVVARSEDHITGWDGSAVRALTDVAAQLSARLGYAGGEGSQPTRGGEIKAAKPVKAVAERRRFASSQKRGGFRC
jgi:DNA-binding IclR family transcriptional regulator